MAISLKHSYQSAVPDGGDTGLVQPSDWNAEHAITMATARMLGRTTGGTGAVEELDASAVRTFAGLVIGTNVQAYDADLTTWAGITPGTGVGTALAINVGSAGAFVTFNGAGGTPASLTLTNATGLPTILAANEAADATCFPAFFTAATGELGPKTNAGLTFNSSTGLLGATNVAVTDDAYAAGWNGSANVPTKNAIYDKIESMSAGGLTMGAALAVATMQPLAFQ
jgi:hypothetical protein